MASNEITDDFGHRVPTREEMRDDDEDHPDEALEADPVKEQMEIRAARFHAQY